MIASILYETIMEQLLNIAPIYSHNMRHVDKDKRVKARMPLRPSKDYEVQDKELTTEIIAGLYGKDQMKCLFETRKYK